jgi:hypothetical protein
LTHRVLPRQSKSRLAALAGPPARRRQREWDIPAPGRHQAARFFSSTRQTVRAPRPPGRRRGRPMARRPITAVLSSSPHVNINFTLCALTLISSPSIILTPAPRSYATLGLGPSPQVEGDSSGRPCSPGHRRLGRVRVPVPDHDHPAAFPRPQNNAINHGAGRCVRSVGRSILRWLRTQTCGERAKRDAGRRARGRTQWPQQAKRRASTHGATCERGAPAASPSSSRPRVRLPSEPPRGCHGCPKMPLPACSRPSPVQQSSRPGTCGNPSRVAFTRWYRCRPPGTQTESPALRKDRQGPPPFSLFYPVALLPREWLAVW